MISRRSAKRVLEPIKADPYRSRYESACTMIVPPPGKLLRKLLGNRVGKPAFIRPFLIS